MGGVGSREACSCRSDDAQVHVLEGCRCLALVVRALETREWILGEKLGSFCKEKQMKRLTKRPAWLTGAQGSTYTTLVCG